MANDQSTIAKVLGWTIPSLEVVGGVVATAYGSPAGGNLIGSGAQGLGRQADIEFGQASSNPSPAEAKAAQNNALAGLSGPGGQPYTQYIAAASSAAGAAAPVGASGATPASGAHPLAGLPGPGGVSYADHVAAASAADDKTKT